MPPKRDPRRRAELLDGVVRHLLAHGLGDLSLRPAAAAIGTSPQILLYYFGSKENLLLEAIGAVRAICSASRTDTWARAFENSARRLSTKARVCANSAFRLSRIAA